MLGIHILLIEPDPISADVYRTVLESVGHKVIVAKTAQAAIHEADQHIPDVVVLELQLPQHNGIEFLYEFRSYSEWQSIPVVVHSSVPPHEYEHAATLGHELGVTQFLHKPVTSLGQLLRAVARYEPVMLS